jgi:hypothetical protein
MTDDPDSLACIFGGLQLVDQETETPRDVRVGGVDEVEVVGLVPEVGVERDDAQPFLVLDRVAGIVRRGLLCGGIVDPAVVLPERRDVLVIPAKLLTERSGHAVRRINRLGTGVVVAQHGVDGSVDVRLEHVVDGGLGVLDVSF